MISLSLPKLFSTAQQTGNLPKVKKPSEQQIAAATQAIGSLHDVLAHSLDKATILAHKHKAGVEYTSGKAIKHIKRQGLRQYLSGLFGTNKSLRRIARDLQHHHDDKVRTAANELLQYCKKHPGRQANTATLSQKVFALHAAAQRALVPTAVQIDSPSKESDFEKPTNVTSQERLDEPTLAQEPSSIQAADEQSKPSSDTVSTKDIGLRVSEVVEPSTSSESSESSNASQSEAAQKIDPIVLPQAAPLQPASRPVQGPPAPARFHSAHSGAAVFKSLENHDYTVATYYLADALSLLNQDHPGQLPCVFGSEVSTPDQHPEGTIKINHHGRFAKLIREMALVHIEHDTDPEVRQAGAELLAIAQHAFATSTPIPNDENLSKPLDVIALKVRKQMNNPTFINYYAKVIDQKTATQ